jgi:hypothetical protein
MHGRENVVQKSQEIGLEKEQLPPFNLWKKDLNKQKK